MAYGHWSVEAWLSCLTSVQLWVLYALKFSCGTRLKLPAYTDAWTQTPTWFHLFPSLASPTPLIVSPGGTALINPLQTNPHLRGCCWGTQQGLAAVVPGSRVRWWDSVVGLLTGQRRQEPLHCGKWSADCPWQAVALASLSSMVNWGEIQWMVLCWLVKYFWHWEHTEEMATIKTMVSVDYSWIQLMP